jgi:hypothetical protein
MSDKEMIVVHEESHEADAQIVAGFLESQGIEAMISEDDAGDQLPSFELVRGVKVLVAAEDADRARELLTQREAGGEAGEESDEP